MKLKILVLMLLLPNMVFAANIFGTVYDLSLSPQTNAIITIDTVPEQTLITKDGTYVFTLSPGTYHLKVEYKEDGVLLSQAEDEVKIVEEGEYRVDVILLDVTDEDLLVDTEFEVENGTDEMPFWLMVEIVIFFMVILVPYPVYRFIKARKADKDEALSEHVQKDVLQKVQVEKITNSRPLSTEHAQKDIPQKEMQPSGLVTGPLPEQNPELADDLEKVIKMIKDEGGRTTQKLIRKKLGHSEAKISLMITELEHKGLVVRIKKGRGNVIALKHSSSAASPQ